MRPLAGNHGRPTMRRRRGGHQANRQAFCLTVTGKGQIRLPAAACRSGGLRPGDRLAFSLRPNGDIVVRPLRPRIAAPAGSPGQPQEGGDR